MNISLPIWPAFRSAPSPTVSTRPALQLKCGIFELMPHFSWRAGRVDTVGDGADRKAGHIGNEIFIARVAHDGDAIAGLNAKRDQSECEGFDVVAIFAPGD